MLSLLESRYGLIIPLLTQTWGSREQFERHIGTLFFDSRWDRKGWPASAWAELQFLHALIARPMHNDIQFITNLRTL